MFIINRKIGETIVIGENIEVTLVQVQLGQDQVRLGINAPREVTVYRKEVLQAIRRENRRAAAAPTQLPTTLPTLRKPVPPDAGENNL